LIECIYCGLVCRYVISPSIEKNGREMSSDFLHDVPEKIDRQFNLTNVILACARTESTDERLIHYEKLLNILSKIV
jgi:hypothetical protein